MAAQGHDPPAGAAHVAQQHLQDRGGADVLHPVGVLVQPTEYTNAVVRSRPELRVTASAIAANDSRGTPHTCSTSSGCTGRNAS